MRRPQQPEPASPAKRQPPGRPQGSFTQHRRMDQLRQLLHQHPRGLTLYEVADRLHVTARSARRYLTELRRELELEPVVIRPGGPQRWRIVASEVPRRVALRRTQAYALLAARNLFEPMRGSALFEEIDLAASSLLGVARRPGRGPNAGFESPQLEQRFVYLPFARKDYSAQSEALDDLFQAVADLRPLSCLYEQPEDGELRRLELHPYALLLYKDAIHILARNVVRGRVEALLLDRIRDTQLLSEESFELPADFDVRDFVQGQFGIWPAAEQTFAVVIDFDAPVADYVTAREVHPTQQIEQLPGGGVRLRLQLGRLAEVATWILGFGSSARVVSPPELIERVRRELGSALGRYAG